MAMEAYREAGTAQGVVSSALDGRVTILDSLLANRNGKLCIAAHCALTSSKDRPTYEARRIVKSTAADLGSYFVAIETMLRLVIA